MEPPYNDDIDSVSCQQLGVSMTYHFLGHLLQFSLVLYFVFVKVLCCYKLRQMGTSIYNIFIGGFWVAQNVGVPVLLY